MIDPIRAMYARVTREPAFLAHALQRRGELGELAELLGVEVEAILHLGLCLAPRPGQALGDYAAEVGPPCGVDPERLLALLQECFSAESGGGS